MSLRWTSALVLGASLAGVMGGAIVGALTRPMVEQVLAGDALRRAIEGATVGALPFLQGFGCNGDWWLTGPIAGLWANYTIDGEELCITTGVGRFGGCRHIVRAGNEFWMEVIEGGQVVSRVPVQNANTGSCSPERPVPGDG